MLFGKKVTEKFPSHLLMPSVTSLIASDWLQIRQTPFICDALSAYVGGTLNIESIIAATMPEQMILWHLGLTCRQCVQYLSYKSILCPIRLRISKFLISFITAGLKMHALPTSLHGWAMIWRLLLLQTARLSVKTYHHGTFAWIHETCDSVTCIYGSTYVGTYNISTVSWMRVRIISCLLTYQCMHSQQPNIVGNVLLITRTLCVFCTRKGYTEVSYYVGYEYVILRNCLLLWTALCTMVGIQASTRYQYTHCVPEAP